MNNTCGEPVTVRFVDLHRNCIDLAVIVFGYVFPILTVLVTTMNVLIVIVFLKPHMRSLTTLILTLIACVDIVNIACPASAFSYLYLRGHYRDFLTSEQIKLSYILGKICVDMLNMVSLWLTVLLAFIRCRHISSPFVARNAHSSRNLIIYIIALLIFAGFVHVPSFYIFDFKSVTHIDLVTNVTEMIGALVESEGVFLKSCSGRKLHIIVETIADSILPCVVLICCNSKILITLRRAKQSRLTMRPRDSMRVKIKKENNEKKTSVANGSSVKKDSRVDKISAFEEDTSKISKQCRQNDICKQDLLKDTENSGCMKYSLFKCHTLHNCCIFKSQKIRARILSDSALDKLDKKGERTSLLILLISSIVVLHEFPLAVLHTYTLATYTDKALPLSHGCYSIIILLWQFVTYPAIFLIYCCMCKTFRKELWKVLTCFCRQK